MLNLSEMFHPIWLAADSSKYNIRRWTSWDSCNDARIFLKICIFATLTCFSKSRAIIQNQHEKPQSFFQKFAQGTFLLMNLTIPPQKHSYHTTWLTDGLIPSDRPKNIGHGTTGWHIDTSPFSVTILEDLLSAQSLRSPHLPVKVYFSAIWTTNWTTVRFYLWWSFSFLKQWK